MPTEEIIHFVGPTLRFGSVVRLRCLWCGALVQEQDLDRISMPEADRDPARRGQPIHEEEVHFFRGLVGVSGTNPRSFWSVDEPEDRQAPERSCMVLMPAEVS